MRQLLNCLFIVGILLTAFAAKAQTEVGKTYTLQALEAKKLKANADKSIPVVTDEELKARLAKLSNQVPMTYNRLVKSHIKAYVERRRTSSETIISRSTIYFPIFENALIRHNLPSDLKYLAIIESALNPKALSPAGAKGLWQFMPGTGKQYNLRINKYVDERSDPYAASDAAARFLKDLYKRYDNWLLVIAAYNCGPGRVNKAIKKAGTSDYWKMIRYLPKETRNYVPAFIAAAYMMNYYHLHNLYPEFPEYDLQVTEKVKLYKRMTLSQIAKESNTSLETVKFLNPSYKRNYIPKSSKGYFVILPISNMTAFKANVPEAKAFFFEGSSYTQPKAKLASYESNENRPMTSSNAKKRVEYKKVRKVYRVKRGDNLGKIARKYKVSVSKIRKWNRLKSSMIYTNQKLVIYKTKKIIIEEPIEMPVIAQDNLKPTFQADIAEPTVTQVGIPTGSKLMKYEVEKGDTFWKIANQYKGISIHQILAWNQLNATSQLNPGMQLNIYAK